jgi:alpha,alpha-trehalase
MRHPKVLISLVALAVSLVAAPAKAGPAPPHALSIFDYIKNTWSVLTRSQRDLARAAVDPKFPPPPNGRWPVFIPEDESLPSVEQELSRALGPQFGKIELRILPHDALQTHDPGLLYLPLPYVVPGGRFNEMYGWDSFFIQMGLLRDGEFALAKDLADNFVYEIRHYGKILNANRTYYLTRSQPPFLTQMVLAVYRKTQDRDWLARAWPAVEQYYKYWTAEPHLTPETGLSRYYDLGEGPAPEVVSSELDRRGRTDYDRVLQYFQTHRVTEYDPSQFYDSKHNRLTALFYKGDRSMRESGFDPSNRFGPFGADIIHYNPVCLNTLLYLMEMESSQILEVLGRHEDAELWVARARKRAEKINRLMWDAGQGLYFDYNFEHRVVRKYPFLTTFYPLWAGIASADQAARVAANLPFFERPGGLQTSTRQTGNQWDAPFGWAPLEWIAVQGLRRYGYQAEADRIATKFLSLVLHEYAKHGVIVEKYDVVRSRTDVGRDIRFGYTTNEAGFGWTNAVFTALFDGLPPGEKEALRVMDEGVSRRAPRIPVVLKPGAQR